MGTRSPVVIARAIAALLFVGGLARTPRSLGAADKPPEYPAGQWNARRRNRKLVYNMLVELATGSQESGRVVARAPNRPVTVRELNRKAKVRKVAAVKAKRAAARARKKKVSRRRR
jgi:hypothetical protein